MSARRTYSFAFVIGAILLFTGGSLQAQQSGGGTSSGGSSMGSGSGNTGDSTGSMNQGHESSGKMKQEPSGPTGKVGGLPQHPSRVPGPDSDGFSKPGLKTPPGGTGSSGGTGSPGGAGSR